MSTAQPLVSCRRVSLIEVIVGRGQGVESDPYRTVMMFFDDAGLCVAEHDPVFPTPWYAPLETCAQMRGRQ